MSVKPFSEYGSYTMFHNSILEIVMPKLSGNEWKVLSFIIRKTKGYQKEEDQISYTQIRKGTGIGSFSTIQDALATLEREGYVIATPGTTKTEATAYRLNTDLELDWQPTKPGPEPTEKPATTKTVVQEEAHYSFCNTGTTVSVTQPTTVSVNTKESIKENNKERIGAERPLVSSKQQMSYRETVGQFKGYLSLIEQGKAPLTESGNKMTRAGVLTDLIEYIYGQRPDTGLVAKFAKDYGGVWRTVALVEAHANDNIQGAAIAWLMGCAKQEKKEFGGKIIPGPGNTDYQPRQITDLPLSEVTRQIKALETAKKKNMALSQAELDRLPALYARLQELQPGNATTHLQAQVK